MNAIWSTIWSMFDIHELGHPQMFRRLKENLFEVVASINIVILKSVNKNWLSVQIMGSWFLVIS